MNVATWSVIAICSRWPSPSFSRWYSAARMAPTSTMPVPVSPTSGPGFIGSPSGSAGEAGPPEDPLGDRVEAREVPVGRVLGEPLHLGVDQPGVPRRQRLPGQAKAVDHPGRE